MTMSEVGLDAGFWGDLYIVMGDNLGKGESHPFTLQTAYSLVMARRHFNGTWRIMFSHQFEEKNAMNKKFILFLPLILLLSVCLLLFVGLHKDPKQIASALINKPVPEFLSSKST